jgi:Fur family peroxide stress response transcriptional regulator
MTKIKHSRKRDAILERIRSTDIHPSAEWVYSGLKHDFPDLSLGTVYRNIAMLKASGMLKSVGTVHGEERFDGDTSEHVHFVCERCGKVVDIAPSPLFAENDAVEIEHEYGVCVTRRQLIYFGKCGDCVEAAESEALDEFGEPAQYLL